MTSSANIFWSNSTVSQAGCWYWYSQDAEQFFTISLPSGALYCHTHPISPPSEFILHFYNFIISRLLCKWNHTTHDLLDLAFCFFTFNSFKIYPKLLHLSVLHCFYYWVISYGGLPWWLSGKEFVCQCRRHGFEPWGRRKQMATDSNVLAWEILWTEEPGGLQSMGSQESDMTYWLNNNNILWYRCTAVCLTNHLLKDS